MVILLQRNDTLLIHGKRVVSYFPMELFRVGKGILALLKDMDTVIIRLVCNQLALGKIGHV